MQLEQDHSGLDFSYFVLSCLTCKTLNFSLHITYNLYENLNEIHLPDQHSYLLQAMG